MVDKVVVLFNHINNTNENERDESDRSFYETLKDEFLVSFLIANNLIFFDSYSNFIKK